MDLVCDFFLTFELVFVVVQCYRFEGTLQTQCCFSIEQCNWRKVAILTSGMQRWVLYHWGKCRGIHALFFN